MSHFIEYWRIVRAYIAPLSLTELARDPYVIETAHTLVRYYYHFLPYIAFLYLLGSTGARQNFEPIWPVSWARLFELEYGETLAIVRTFFFITAFLAVFFYHSRTVRFLVFFAAFQVHALESSFGYVNHQWYLWVFTSAILICLPPFSEVREHARDRMFLLVVWWAQAMLALIYTMAGINKLIAANQQYWAGEIGSLSVGNFSYLVADWLPKLQHEAVLAPLVIQHPHIAWFPFVALVFLQTFSLWVMVRPSLQRVWAVCIVAFHIGTYLTMGIEFYPLMLLVFLLFFNSPFIPRTPTLRCLLEDLPFIGPAIRVWLAYMQKAGR